MGEGTPQSKISSIRTSATTSTAISTAISAATSTRTSAAKLGITPYSIKLYIPTTACNTIPASISNAILMSLSTTQRQLKVAYRAYKALFRLEEEV
jgi:hypothetical protein